jgi:hypothetical protein
MSVWAQSWAYEQRLGRWRETEKGKMSWKGDPGAKSVLAAVATFADENGYAYCGQDTLAEMTDMTERSVREHLHNLEHAYCKIRREHRRKGSGRSRGEFTSDGIWLLAPAHRLRPPKRGEIAEIEPAEEFSDGEKRAHRRKSLPPGGRKNFPGNRQGGEPSEDPSGVPASPGHRPDTYAGMVEEQSRLLGVPLDPEERRNLLVYARRLIGEQNAGPVSMLRWAAHYATRRAENPKVRPSQAWADVAADDGDDGRGRRWDSTAVVGATQDAYEGDF